MASWLDQVATACGKPPPSRQKVLLSQERLAITAKEDYVAISSARPFYRYENSATTSLLSVAATKKRGYLGALNVGLVG